VLYQKRPAEEELESVRICGGRYGFSIDFGLEVVEKQSVCDSIFCDTIFESEFMDLNQETQAQDCLIVTRDRAFCHTTCRK